MQFKGVIVLMGLLSLLVAAHAQDDAFAIITPANAEQLAVIQTIQLTETHANQIAFNPTDSTQLAVAQDNGVVSIWDLRSQQIIKTWDLGNISVVSMEYSLDGERLLGVLKNGELFIWETTNWSHINSLAISGQTAQMLDVAEDNLLAVSYTNGPVRLWDSKTGEMIVQVQSVAAGVMGMDLNPEGTQLALGYAWGGIFVFNLHDVRSGNITLGFTHKTGELNDVALRPSSQYKQDEYDVGVFSISNFAGLEIWYVVYGVDKYYPLIDMAYPDLITFNSDGRLVAVSGKETAAGGGCEPTPSNLCHVEILYRESLGRNYTDLANKIVADLRINDNLLTDMNFSSDDRFFAASSYNETIMIWGIPQP